MHGHGQTLRRKEVGGWEVAYPANKISTLIRNFSQNADHFALHNMYTQMRGLDFFGWGGVRRPGHLKAPRRRPGGTQVVRGREPPGWERKINYKIDSEY